MLVGGRNGLGRGVLWIALLNTRGPGGSGATGPRRCRTFHRDVRYNRVLPHPRTDGVDSLRCHAVRRVDADC